MKYYDDPKTKPDLILIDGGKSQLRFVNEVISKSEHKKIDVISIVKGANRVRATETIIEENGVLEIDKYGILKQKEFYNKDDMNEIQVAKSTTEAEFKRNSFIYEFMSSMRQKINDPLGQRAKKRKEISQR